MGRRYSEPASFRLSGLPNMESIKLKPLCVGFGISTPRQAKRVARVADGVIVGSRIIQLMEAEDNLISVGNFTKELRHALDELSEEEKL